MRALERGQRAEDAEHLGHALDAALQHPDQLTETIAAARDKVQRWRSQTASEAKLQRALREGATTQQLARAIQDASAAGVKVRARSLPV